MKSDFHDWRTCTDPECDECQLLVDEGIVMGCDGDDCDARGHVDTDYHSWRIMPEGIVLCISCYERSGLPDMFEAKNNSLNNK